MRNNYFKIAEDLTEKEEMNKYFEPAGDLGKTNQETFIKNYLLEVVSGKEIERDEFNFNIISGGSMIVSFNKLQQMVEEGCYNFVKAEYLNPEMIIVEYQKYQKENSITK